MKKAAILILILTFIYTNSKGQDIHFSQYFNTPLIINPALTGVFGGDQRAMLAYRNQWASVASPYKTYGVSFDTRLFEKSRKNFLLGVGFNVYKDVAGDTELGITSAGLSVSGIVKIHDKQHLTAGVHGGFDQRSINQSNMIWDNQFDGQTYIPTAPSFEFRDYNKPFGIADVNVGVAWIYSDAQKTITSNDAFSVKAGLVYNHLTKPDISYGDVADNLYDKITFHTAANIGIANSSLSVLPIVVFNKQGPNSELLFGALLRHRIKEDSKYTGIFQESAIAFGVHSRWGDALIPSITYEISHWKLCVSYDANISDLAVASDGVGGFEITLTFVNPSPFGSGKSKARFN